MNKQRKVLITITYNEMGIIIDTKAEEVAQPNLQPTCNQLATDCISRQAAIDALGDGAMVNYQATGHDNGLVKAIDIIKGLPSAQPEERTDKRTEMNACDCINRQAAINEITEYGSGETIFMSVGELKRRIEHLPSAQPEERTEECTKTHACDCISREAAIDDLYGRDPSQIWDTADIEVWINALPSVQPEIIHCRDCRYWIPGSITDKDDFIPPKCGKYQQMVGRENGEFFSLAERVEE